MSKFNPNLKLFLKKSLESFIYITIIKKSLLSFLFVKYSSTNKLQLGVGNKNFDYDESFLYSTVIINDPHSNKRFISFVLGVEGEYVFDRNSGIYHRVPQNHIWVTPFKENYIGYTGYVPLQLIDSKVFFVVEMEKDNIKILSNRNIKEYYLRNIYDIDDKIRFKL